MVQWLKDMGVSSNVMYAASMLSILLSVVMWFLPRNGDPASQGRPERFAIFVGLWPPTLALLGHALREEERNSITG